jgi:hypothetical protein
MLPFFPITRLAFSLLPTDNVCKHNFFQEGGERPPISFIHSVYALNGERGDNRYIHPSSKRKRTGRNDESSSLLVVERQITFWQIGGQSGSHISSKSTQSSVCRV